MLRFRVGGKAVEHVNLVRKKDRAWRLDLFPLAFLYGLWVTVVVTSIGFGDALIVLGGLIALHTLVWLFTAWSVDFKCLTQFTKVDDVQKANACKVTPAKYSGSKEVVPLHFLKLVSENLTKNYTVFGLLEVSNSRKCISS